MFRNSNITDEKILDLLVLTEPLACVLHAYRKFTGSEIFSSACIFGAGPIGVLHLLELKRLFNEIYLAVVEPNAKRRKLIKSIFPEIDVYDHRPDRLFDLSIVCTSDPKANIDAILTTDVLGYTIHFSGLNHKTRKDLVYFEGLDIESIHRKEECLVLKNGKRLLGSSGYTKKDIEDSYFLIVDNPEYYAPVQTTVVNGLSSKTLFAKPDDKLYNFETPVIENLLNSDGDYFNHLKVVFRLNREENNFQVIPRKHGPKFKAMANSKSINDQLNPGWSRIKMLRVSICNTDRRVLDGTKASDITETLVLGHEGVGIVVETTCDKIKKDDLTLVLPHLLNKDDPYLKRGIPFLSPKLKHLGVHVNGCFASYIDLPNECLFQLKQAENSLQAAAL